MNTRKRWFSLVLCMVLCLGLLPGTVWAETKDRGTPEKCFADNQFNFPEEASTNMASNNNFCEENDLRAQCGSCYVEDPYESSCVEPQEKLDFAMLLSSDDNIVIHKGIDVSAHQGSIDWDKVATQIDFAILRCGYGRDRTSQDDKYWAVNVAACQRLGIPFGVYLYSYAESDEQAASEAEHVLRLLEGVHPNLPVYLDLEDEETVGTLSNADILRHATTFCNAMLEHGYTPGVYANKYWWTTHLTDSAYDQWSRWIAQVGVSQPTYNKSYDIWQYSFKGSVSGITGDVDLDYYYGALEPPHPVPPEVEYNFSSSKISGSSLPTAASQPADKGSSYYGNLRIKSGTVNVAELYITPPNGSETRFERTPTSGTGSYSSYIYTDNKYIFSQSGTYKYRWHISYAGNTKSVDYSGVFQIKGEPAPEVEFNFSSSKISGNSLPTAASQPAEKGSSYYANLRIKSGTVNVAELYITPPNGSETRFERTPASGTGSYSSYIYTDNKYTFSQSGTYTYRWHISYAGNTASKDFSGTFVIKTDSVTVSFNANGGSVSPTSKVVECTSTYGTLPTPSRTGNYSFDGWYTAASGGSKVTAATTVTATSNHTLYAHWTPGQNTLFLYNNYSGKNYFYDSDFNTSLNDYCWTTRDSSVAKLEIDRSLTYGGYNSLKVTNTSAGSDGKDLILRTKTQGNTGEGFVGDNRSMILSFWAKSSQNGTKMYIRWGYETEYRNVTLSSSWQKYTVRMDKTSDLNDCMHPFFDRAGTVWLCQLQLEDGTTATDFIPETSGTYSSSTGQYGGNFTLPNAPTRSGYTFDGWYLEASGKTKLNTKVEGNLCAFAHWTANQYTVTLNANGGSVSPTSITVTYGGTYSNLPTNPTRTGYTFAGWYTAASGGSQVTTSTKVTATANHTLYAHWTANQYTVTLNANGGSVSPTSINVTYGGTYANLPTPTREWAGTLMDYRFEGWYTAASGGTQVTTSTKVTATSNHTLYAHWIPIYSLDLNGYLDGAFEINTNDYGTFDVYINGSLVKDNTADYYDAWTSGTTYEIKDIRALDGYVYNGVEVGAIKGTIGSENIEVALSFSTKDKYTVTLDPNGGSVSPTSIKATYAETYSNLPTNPTRTGYTFNGWYTAKDGGTQVTTSTKVTAMENHTLYAHWTQTVVPVTSVTLNKTALSLTAGDAETLTATISPSNATNKSVTWTTSDASVATVSNGTVTAVGAGTANITVTTADGSKTAKCTVTVEEAPVDPTSPVVRVGDATVTSGNTFTVPVAFLNNPGITGFSLELSYDKNYLELTSVADGEFTVLTKSKEITENPYVIVWNHGTADQTGTTAATLTFRAKDGVEGTTQIQVAFRNGEKPWNVADESIPFTAKSGTVTIRSYIPGDANGDGVVSGRDATRVVQYVAGWDVKIDMSAADANGDGAVSGRDATRIVQYVAGWNVTLGQTAPKLLSLLGSAPSNQRLVVGNGTAAPGDTVTIPVTFQNNPGITGFSIAIDYDDDALELIAARSGDFDRLTLSPTIDTKPYRVVWQHGTVNMTGSVAVELDFRVKNGATGSTTVSCSYISGEKPWNVSDAEVDFELVNGTVTIGSAATLNVIGISGTTMTWSTNLNGAGKTLTAIAAWYDANGRLLGTSAKPMTATGSMGNQTINVGANAAEYRMFLLDGNSSPVVKSWKSK